MHSFSRLKGVLGIAALAAALGATAVSAAAQATGTVRGNVTEAGTQRPLAGVQVVVGGTGRGGLTNAAGEYQVAGVPAGSHVVRATLIGYNEAQRPVAVSAGQTASANFQLSASAISLDALVVTGTAGATQRRAIGNAVSSVKAEEVVAAAPVNNVQELLTARAPGLTLLSNSGQAGSSSRIRIRGAGSLSGRQEPVIYVDGVRMYSGTAGGYSTGSGVVQGTNPLDAINPNDIESVEVIKGPAAATLYGADAAAGVIQIITKKGRGVGGVEWTAEMETGQVDWHLETPERFWLCQPSQIGGARNARLYPGCQGMDPNAPGAQRLLVENPLRQTYQCQFTENCQPNPIRDGGTFGMNVSARGSGEGYNFFVSGERNSEQGVFYNNYSGRTSLRGNFGFTLGEKLDFGINTSYALNDVRMPLNNNASNSVLRNAYRYRPGVAGPYTTGWRGFMPEFSNQYDNTTEYERFILGGTANFRPFSWFSSRLTVGLDQSDRVNQVFYKIDESGRAPWGNTAATGAVYRYLPNVHVWTADYNATATNDLTSDVRSSFSAGMQYNAYRFESHEAIGEGLVANSLNLVGAAATTRADQDIEEQNSLGFFVQEQLGWRERVFLTGAVRVDDNSAFGEDFSVVVYPKLSASWVVSEEPFFNVGLFDNLKLRAAWGQAGNAPEPFSADRTLGPGLTVVGDVPVNQLGFRAYGNPNLKAETGQEVEVGFDASLLQGRLGAELTFYDKTTKDALIGIPDPRSSGYSGTHLTNVGEINNRGVELLLTGSPVRTDALEWDANLSISSNRNELVSFGGVREEIVFGSFADVQKHAEGYPLGGFWATDVVRDASGNPVLTARGAVTLEDEMEYVGPMLPTREIGFSNTVTLFSTLRLFANLDYKGGNYQWCAICSINNRFDRNTWQVNNPDATPADLALYSSRQTKTYIVPADFVKLRELSATLLLPRSWTGRVGASQASLTLSGRNLAIWTEYDDRTGFPDPEVQFNSTSSFSTLDYGSAPMMRRIVLSARVSF